MLDPYQRQIDDAVRTMRIGLTRIVDDEQLRVEKLEATLRALSPQSTLDRGYAVLQSADGHVVDDAATLKVGDEITVTLRRGAVVAQTTKIVEP